MIPTRSLFPIIAAGLRGISFGLRFQLHPAGLPPWNGFNHLRMNPTFSLKSLLFFRRPLPSKGVLSSPASSSNVLPFVSGIRNDTTVPHSMKSAKICIKWPSHGDEQPLPWQCPLASNGGAMTCAMMAPIFPIAALKPCPVLLYLVGKHSPGTINVVAFGPKLKKS